MPFRRQDTVDIETGSFSDAVVQAAVDANVAPVAPRTRYGNNLTFFTLVSISFLMFLLSVVVTGNVYMGVVNQGGYTSLDMAPLPIIHFAPLLMVYALMISQDAYGNKRKFSLFYAKSACRPTIVLASSVLLFSVLYGMFLIVTKFDGSPQTALMVGSILWINQSLATLSYISLMYVYIRFFYNPSVLGGDNGKPPVIPIIREGSESTPQPLVASLVPTDDFVPEGQSHVVNAQVVSEAESLDRALERLVSLHNNGGLDRREFDEAKQLLIREKRQIMGETRSPSARKIAQEADTDMVQQQISFALQISSLQKKIDDLQRSGQKSKQEKYLNRQIAKLNKTRKAAVKNPLSDFKLAQIRSQIVDDPDYDAGREANWIHPVRTKKANKGHRNQEANRSSIGSDLLLLADGEIDQFLFLDESIDDALTFNDLANDPVLNNTNRASTGSRRDSRRLLNNVFSSSVRFHNDWNPIYYRNERFNLQCFPTCFEFGEYSIGKIQGKNHTKNKKNNCAGAVECEMVGIHPELLDVQNFRIFGHITEYRALGFSQSTPVGKVIDGITLDAMQEHGTYIAGALRPVASREDGVIQFSFLPPKKKTWDFHGELDKRRKKDSSTPSQIFGFEILVFCDIEIVKRNTRLSIHSTGSAMSANSQTSTRYVLISRSWSPTFSISTTRKLKRQIPNDRENAKSNKGGDRAGTKQKK